MKIQRQLRAIAASANAVRSLGSFMLESRRYLKSLHSGVRDLSSEMRTLRLLLESNSHARTGIDLQMLCASRDFSERLRHVVKSVLVELEENRSRTNGDLS